MRRDAAPESERELESLGGWFRRRVSWVALVAVYVSLCVTPHLWRLSGPSLYADDVVRVAELEQRAFSEIVFRPFNEHVAPLFETVSWVTWRVSGERLTAAPGAFTVASLVPVGLVVGVLGFLIRRETGSVAAGLAGVAVFSLSSLALETYWWYSASSFMWALAATLGAWAGAARGDRRGLLLAGGAALAAPAFSGIGLLAGPVAGLRLVTGRGGRSWLGILAPLGGTILYLSIALSVHDRGQLTGTMRHHADVMAGVVAALRAPVAVLLPAQVGWKTGVLELGLPAWVEGSVGLMAILGVFFWGVRSRQRALILGGLALVVGGYLLIYPARAGLSPGTLLRTQRYHLFPLAGLILIGVAAGGPVWGWLQGRPRASLRVGILVAAVVMGFQWPGLTMWARVYRFPDQAGTLAALERLGGICREAGITRGQALAALDRPRVAWLPMEEFSPLMLMPEGASESRVEQGEVRGVVLGRLSGGEREALFGGMDATPYLQPAGMMAERDVAAVGRLVRTYHVKAEGGISIAEGRPAYVEYAINGVADARALVVPAAGPELEIWWTDEGGEWGPSRSVRWGHEGGEAGGQAVALERLPHFDPARTRRLRIVIREPGRVAIEAPRLVR